MAITNAERQPPNVKCVGARWTRVPWVDRVWVPDEGQLHENEGERTERVHTFMKSLSRLCSLARLERRLADAVHRHLERLSTCSSNDKPAPATSNSGSVHPR